MFQKAGDGFRIVRRSDQKWEGLSTDLVVEQVLMRSMKMSGGLTRGRGMTGEQWLVGLLSMPVCVEMNCTMLELTGVSYSTSKQNKNISEANAEACQCNFNKGVDVDGDEDV